MEKNWRIDLENKNLHFEGYSETAARHSKHGLEKVRLELEKDGLLVKEVVLVKGLPPSAVIPILSIHAYWTEEENREYSRQMREKEFPITLSPPIL